MPSARTPRKITRRLLLNAAQVSFPALAAICAVGNGPRVRFPLADVFRPNVRRNAHVKRTETTPMMERTQSYKTALVAGAGFGLLFGFLSLLQTGLFPPSTSRDAAALVAVVVISGGLFGLIVALFLRSPLIPQPADMDLEPSEDIEHTGLANHFLNLDGRGGRLALTNRHLLFTPHAINLQRSGLRIPRSQIVRADAVRTLGIVPNGVAVTLKSGKTERFVVSGRDEWMRRLNQL